MSENPFHRRRDENGIFESICTVCFKVVARAKTEAELAVHEQSHKCDPQDLAPKPRRYQACSKE
jgi:hypothetical protein